MPDAGDAPSQPADLQVPLSPAASGAAPPKPPRFKLYLIPVGIAAVASVAVLAGSLRGLARSDPDGFRISQAMGAVVGLLLWPLLAAWIVFRLAGRSNRVGNAAFIVVLLLCLVAHATRTRVDAPTSTLPQKDQTSIAEIRAISEEARKASLEGDEERALKLTAESAAKLDEVAATAKGSEKIVMEYAANLARAQNEVLKQYITAAGVYSDAGGASLIGLADPESLERRLALLGTAISTHDAVIVYFRTISDRIPRDLSSKGVAKKDSDEFLSGFVANAKIENLLAIHAAEHRMLLAARKRFDLLKSKPGVWSVSPQGELIAGEGFLDTDIAEFRRLQSEIDRLAEKQGVLIEERKSGG